MIIDFHAHTFPDAIAARAVAALAASSGISPFSDGRVSSLSAAARDAGISLTLNLPVATRPGQWRSMARTGKDMNETAGAAGLVSFAGIHPWDEEPEKILDVLKDMGFKGIKLHPVFQDTAVDDPRTLRILRGAAERDMIVTIHGGMDISFPDRRECSWEHILSMLEKVPPKKLVLAHMGAWGQWKEAERFLGTPGLWLDTSFCLVSGNNPNFLSKEQFVRMVRLHGTDRILFGTDSPWSSLGGSVELIRSSGLDEVEIDRILSGNARALLGI
ncbi:MAG: amidohydrolase [Clostridia bacterium]|nr:amidohydrolase [Clostridia bacterium]